MREHYSWEAHAEGYLEKIRPLPERHVAVPDTRPLRRAIHYRDRALFSDLDQSLLGDPQGVERFAETLRKNRRCTNFGIATGRRLDSALTLLKRHGLPAPDVLITSLGTQIHYGAQLVADDHWSEHLDHLWKPAAVRRALAELPGLTPQPKGEQSRFKVSYLYDPGLAPSVEEISDPAALPGPHGQRHPVLRPVPGPDPHPRQQGAGPALRGPPFRHPPGAHPGGRRQRAPTRT